MRSERDLRGPGLVEKALDWGGQVVSIAGGDRGAPLPGEDAGGNRLGQISALYGRLLELNRSPVNAPNKAVAVAISVGLEEVLREIEELGASGE